jgi:hypothetical protein
MSSGGLSRRSLLLGERGEIVVYHHNSVLPALSVLTLFDGDLTELGFPIDGEGLLCFIVE